MNFSFESQIYWLTGDSYFISMPPLLTVESSSSIPLLFLFRIDAECLLLLTTLVTASIRDLKLTISQLQSIKVTQGSSGYSYGRIYGATLHKDHFRHLLSTPQRVSAYVLGAALYNVLRIYTKKNASNYFKFTIFRRDAHSNFKN